MPLTRTEIVAELTGPDQPFELVPLERNGRKMRVFRNGPRSLRERVQMSADAFGEREFLIQGERRVSYREFARLVWGAARSLRERGLAPGDRIAVLGHNDIDYVVTAFAAASFGAVVVALNGWWVEEELAYGIADSGSRFLAVDHRLFPRIQSLVESKSKLDHVLQIGGGPVPGDAVPAEEWIVPCDEPPEESIEGDAPFVILYTSGTTGRPKGCITTHAGTLTQVTGILLHAAVSGRMGNASPVGEGRAVPTALLTAPLFHVAGIHTGLCTAMTAGARVVFPTGRFNVEEILALMVRETVTTWSTVPTLLHRLVHSEELARFDLSNLRSISFGGAPCPTETAEKARTALRIPPSLTNGYGLTETHGIVMMNSGTGFEAHPQSVGQPVVFFDVKILDVDGKEVPEGTLGELVVSGPTVTPGYWNRPQETAEAIRDGWLHTGDLAYRDSNGFYFVVDRAKDMILRGGENVYCAEIESCLAAHPSVDEAAVVGAPDPELGERVKAVVRLLPGMEVTADALGEHVGQHLASFKVPEIVEFTDRPLPRNPAGKIIKSALRGQGAGVFDEELLG